VFDGRWQQFLDSPLKVARLTFLYRGLIEVQIVLDGWKWVPRPSLCEGGSLWKLALSLCLSVQFPLEKG